MTYRPQPVPGNLERDAQAYLAQEFRKLQNTLDVVELQTFVERGAEPSKIADGMVAFADGSNWDPGKGAGLYARVGGAWELASSDLDAAANESITGNWTFDGPTLNATVTLANGSNTLAFTGSGSIADITASGFTRLDFEGLNVIDLQGANLRVRSGSESASYATLEHDGTNLLINTNSTTRVYFDTSVDLRSGGKLRVVDSGNTDYVEFSHNGTDLVADHSGTGYHIMRSCAFAVQDGTPLTKFAVSHTGNAVEVRDGYKLFVYDSSDSDYWRVYHNGTDIYVEQLNATWTRWYPGSSGILTFGGVQQRWYDSGTDDSIRIQHDGDWGLLDLGNKGGGKGIRCRPATSGTDDGWLSFGLNASDDATTSITLPAGGGMYFIIASNTSIAQVNDMMQGVWQSTIVNDLIYERTAGVHSLGTGSNPDVDGDCNVWFTSSGTVMNIKNRRGAFRNYNVFVLPGRV